MGRDGHHMPCAGTDPPPAHGGTGQKLPAYLSLRDAIDGNALGKLARYETSLLRDYDRSRQPTLLPANTTRTNIPNCPNSFQTNTLREDTAGPQQPDPSAAPSAAPDNKSRFRTTGTTLSSKDKLPLWRWYR